MQIKKGNRIVNINFSLNSKENSKHKLTQSDQLVRCNYKNGFLATLKSVAISNIFRLVLNPTHLNCLVSTTGRLLLDSTKTYMSLFSISKDIKPQAFTTLTERSINFENKS